MSPSNLSRLVAGEHKWTRCMEQLFHVRSIISLDYWKTIVCRSILPPSLGPTSLGGKRGKR
jgi:hypothetical protein